MVHIELFGEQIVSGLAARKAAHVVEQGGMVDGVVVRYGDRLGIVTNLGRVEWYAVNEWGGIDLAESYRQRVTSEAHR